MENQTPAPTSVSYRQLMAWLAAAPSDPIEAATLENDPDAERQAFEALLLRWSRSSQDMLAALREAGPAVSSGRSPQQMMALGAMQAHLAMALQALGSYGRRRD